VVCSRTRAGALPTDRPIRDARVPQAIGQSFDWLVAEQLSGQPEVGPAELIRTFPGSPEKPVVLMKRIKVT
jgi:hypothetical protein